MKQRNRKLGRLTAVACTSLLISGHSLVPKAVAADFSNWQFDFGVGSRGTPIFSMLSAVRNGMLDRILS